MQAEKSSPNAFVLPPRVPLARRDDVMGGGGGGESPGCTVSGTGGAALRAAFRPRPLPPLPRPVWTSTSHHLSHDEPCREGGSGWKKHVMVSYCMASAERRDMCMLQYQSSGNLTLKDRRPDMPLLLHLQSRPSKICASCMHCSPCCCFAQIGLPSTSKLTWDQIRSTPKVSKPVHEKPPTALLLQHYTMTRW